MDDKKEQRRRELQLNTIEQNNLVLYDVLKAKQINRLLQFLENGYTLSAFILNCMVDSSLVYYSLQEAVDTCVSYTPDVYDFIAIHWDRKKANAFLLKHNDKQLIRKKFTCEELAQHQLWDILLERGDEGKHLYCWTAPFEYIAKNIQLLDYNGILTKSFICEHHPDLAYRLGENYELAFHVKGIKFLAKRGFWEYLVNAHEDDTVRALGLNAEAFRQKVLMEAGSKTLYKSEQGRKFLLDMEVYEPFIEDYNFDGLLKRQPESEKWEELKKVPQYQVFFREYERMRRISLNK